MERDFGKRQHLMGAVADDGGVDLPAEDEFLDQGSLVIGAVNIVDARQQSFLVFDHAFVGDPLRGIFPAWFDDQRIDHVLDA